MRDQLRVSNEEVWKPVVGYEGFYEVSNVGEVRSLDRTTLRDNRHGRQPTKIKGRVMKQGIRSGYYYVNLCVNNKRKKRTVHSLVAEAFLCLGGGGEVNHKDGVKTNNLVTNLEWCTRSENHKHALANGLFVPPSGEDHWTYKRKYL